MGYSNEEAVKGLSQGRVGPGRARPGRASDLLTITFNSPGRGLGSCSAPGGRWSKVPALSQLPRVKDTNSDDPGPVAAIPKFRSPAPRQGAAAQSQTRMKCVNETGLWQREQRACSLALKPELPAPAEPHMFSSAASFLNCGSEKLKKKKILKGPPS